MNIYLIVNVSPNNPPLSCHVVTFHQKLMPTVHSTVQSNHVI